MTDLLDIIFTARVRSTTGRYCFHRCLSVHRGGRGGYPGQVPPPPPGGVPGSGTPPGGYPGPGTPLGVPGPPTPPGGVPRSRYPPGGTPIWVPPQGGVPRSRYPPPRGGYPGRTTEGVLTTRRAVCLLRSRRRTFLLYLFLASFFKCPSALETQITKSRKVNQVNELPICTVKIYVTDF